MLARIYRHTILEVLNKAFMFLVPPAACAFLLRLLGARIGGRCRIYTPLILTNTAFKNIRMGDSCHIGRDVLLDTSDAIELGSHVVISMRCSLITHTAMAIPALKSRGYDDCHGGITIRDNVYIGAGATILHGVTIGENCVVGACALVNRDIPPDSVVAGVPAKVIKRLAEPS